MQIEQLTNDLHYAVALMEAFHLTSTPAFPQLKDLASDLEQYTLVRHSPPERAARPPTSRASPAGDITGF